MLEGIRGLLDSKKGLQGLVLIIAATTLVALGAMTVEQWQEYTVWIFGIYAGAETVNGTAAIIKGAPARPGRTATTSKKENSEHGTSSS
jgi:hypothetical protein